MTRIVSTLRARAMVPVLLIHWLALTRAMTLPLSPWLLRRCIPTHRKNPVPKSAPSLNPTATQTTRSRTPVARVAADHFPTLVNGSGIGASAIAESGLHHLGRARRGIISPHSHATAGLMRSLIITCTSRRLIAGRARVGPTRTLRTFRMAVGIQRYWTSRLWYWTGLGSGTRRIPQSEW